MNAPCAVPSLPIAVVETDLHCALRGIVPADRYAAFLKPLQVDALTAEAVTLSLPSKHGRVFVGRHYSEAIRAALDVAAPGVRRFDLVQRRAVLPPRHAATAAPSAAATVVDVPVPVAAIVPASLPSPAPAAASDAPRDRIARIQALAAAAAGLSREDLTAADRDARCVRPRQVAMFLAREITNRSLPEIGRRFGDRDHTTVLHACRQVEALRDENPLFAVELDQLRRQIEDPTMTVAAVTAALSAEPALREIMPLAGLDAPTDRGPVPELRWLPIAELRVDEGYQRPITAQGLATIRAIVAGFSWRKFAPVVVCPIEGGFFAIIDGRHRTTAAASCSIECVPCLVIQADRAEQARAFGAINGMVTRISGGQLFKARVAGGDGVARSVKAAADEAGVRLLVSHQSSQKMRPRETSAFRYLEQAITTKGCAVVTSALRSAAAAAGEGRGLLNALVLKAFVEVLAGDARWRADSRLEAACAAFPLAVELDRAGLAAAEAGSSRGVILAARLVTHLSARLDAPPPRSSPSHRQFNRDARRS